MIHLVYLAAGYGKRFGSNKLLYELEGRPMYRHVLDRLAEIVRRDPEIYVLVIVTQYPEICRTAMEMSVHYAINPDPSRGISSSIQTGIVYLRDLNKIHPDDQLVFFQGDQPRLSAELIVRFLHQVRMKDALCAAVSSAGSPVSPCAFKEQLIPELSALSGDRGGKKVIMDHLRDCFLFETEDAEQLADIDQL